MAMKYDLGAPNSPAEELRRLIDETTELGIGAEDIFKDAAEALFAQERELAQGVLANGTYASQAHEQIHQHALALLVRGGLTADQMRQVAEMQRVSAEFTRICEQARQIAECGLALGGASEYVLMRYGGDPRLLRALVRQAYLEIRGAVIVCATRDTARARVLAREDGELDRLYAVLRAVLDSAIVRSPRSAFQPQQLLLVGTAMEAIGNAGVLVCATLLYSPPGAFAPM